MSPRTRDTTPTPRTPPSPVGRASRCALGVSLSLGAWIAGLSVTAALCATVTLLVLTEAPREGTR